MAKGRKKVEVDASVLHKAIQAVEAQQTFTGRTALWEAVSKHLGIEGVTPSVVGLRVKEYQIEVQTAVGKRGGGLKAARAAGKIHRTSKAEKWKGNKVLQASLEELTQVTPERWLPVVEQIKAGSRTAAVKLHCVECSGYLTAEVRECQVMDCALWAFRPYQGKATVEEIAEREATEEKEAA